ncbi:MAG TPA: BTAD domain-containing putative transcriptional regulator [Polyangiaceae bacterium]|nr:BTAD domain-containing putative transcriptional regulator [Polyangiaceae bacterium]
MTAPALALAALPLGCASPSPAGRPPSPPPASAAGPKAASPAAVGYRTVELVDASRPTRATGGRGETRPRRLVLHLWYPAGAGGAALTFASYVGDDEAGLRAQIGRFGAKPEALAALLREPRPARRDAPPSPGRRPLVVFSGGNEGAREWAPLAEALAARGFVAAAVAGSGRSVGDTGEAGAELVLERAGDLERAVARLAAEPDVDARRLGLVSFSAASPAALLYALRTRSVDALVALDGWEANTYGGRVLTRLPGFDPARLRAPYLLVQSGETRARSQDFAFLQGARSSERVLATLPARHLDFIPLMAAAGVGDRAAYGRAAALVTWFLDRRLRGAGPLEPPPGPGDRIELEAEGAASSPDDVRRALLEDRDVAAALALLRAGTTPAFDEGQLNELGYAALWAGRADDAVRVFEHAVEAFPTSANLHDSLGEALAAKGDRAAAVAAYRKALERAPGLASAAEALKNLGESPPPGARGNAPFPFRLVLRPAGGDALRPRESEFAPGKRLDLYAPAGPGPAPLVVVVDGAQGDLRGWPAYRDWARLLAASGMAAALYDGETAEDADRALAFVRDNAARLGVDPSRVCVWASSANARVGVRLPLREGWGELDCAVYYYGAMEAYGVRPDLPALVVRAGRDQRSINDRVDEWTRAALAANAPLTLYNATSLRHGFDVYDDDDASRRLIRDTVSFLRRHLGLEGPAPKPAPRAAPAP